MKLNTPIHTFALMTYRSRHRFPTSHALGNASGHASAGAAHAPQYARYPHRSNDSYARVAITTTTDPIQHAEYRITNASALALEGFRDASRNHRAPPIRFAADAFTGVSDAYDARRAMKIAVKMDAISLAMRASLDAMMRAPATRERASGVVTARRAR